MSTGVIFNEDPDGRNRNSGLRGSVLPIESQYRSLLQYVESGQATLEEIRVDFSISQSNPEDLSRLQIAAKKLAGFCADTDDWGFETLYKVAFGLQVLLINSFYRVHNDVYWEILRQGLAMLSALLNQCESEYHQRLAVDDMLESFNKAACN